MARKININGTLIARPGAFSIIKSGVKNASPGLSFGNICIIDTGFGAGYGGGSGINGHYTQALDSVYSLSTIQDYQNFVKGGELWNFGFPLFRPYQQVNGVSKIYYIRACTTTAGSLALTLANAAITFKVKDEGVIGNGIIVSGNLTKGHAVQLTAGVVNTAKFIFTFYLGSYKGFDSVNGIDYEVTPAASKPNVTVTSPEVATITELVNWAATSNDFTSLYEISSTTTPGGAIVTADLTTYAGYQPFTGGTEVYNSSDLDSALAAITDLDNNFFLALDFGNNATSAGNFKILNYIQTAAKFKKFMFVAGGADRSTLSGSNSSILTAQTYNSENVLVVHGKCKKKFRTTPGFKIYSQLYKTAQLLGRTCGLEPQTPLTFKAIDIDGEVHILSDAEKELAIEGGVIYTTYDYELASFVVGLDVNTLQANDNVINDNGTSYSLPINRITSQLNRLIIIEAKKRFFSGEQGPNRNTITEQDIKSWLEGFLQDQTASVLKDNLILRGGNVVVTTDVTSYYVSYEFVPNFEVDHLIFTGTLLEA